MRSSTTAFLAAALGSWLLGPGMIPVARAYDLDTQNLVPCASEGGVCRMPYPTNVYYGAPNKRAGRPFPQGGAIACNNQNFGDTAPGQPKSCWYAPRIVAGRGTAAASIGAAGPTAIAGGDTTTSAAADTATGAGTMTATGAAATTIGPPTGGMTTVGATGTTPTTSRSVRSGVGRSAAMPPYAARSAASESGVGDWNSGRPTR